MIEVIPHALEKMTLPEIRGFIASIEEQMSLSPDQIDVPVTHHFSKDVYAREIRIPKDSIIVGKIHKFENLNILSYGEMLLVSQDGVKHVKAPFTIVSGPGVKRLALALTDCVWTTVHGTSETDVEKIEENFIAKSYLDVPKNLLLVEEK